MSLHRLFVVALVAGCGQDVSIGELPDPVEPDEGLPLEGRMVTDFVVQAAQPQVDILWTIDNSGSMNCIVGCHGGAGDTDFVRVTNEFDTFMDFLDGSGLDYHIGVTTADPTNRGKLVEYDGIRWIDENTPEPIEVFTDMALSVGTSGADIEAGIGATFEAYEEQGSSANSGFFRANASTHTIVFSNEDDQTLDSVITENEFVRWYSGLRPVVDERTFNSIVCFGVNEACREASSTYINATNEIGGVAWEITSEDYGSLLERLAIQAVAQRAEFFLSQQPVPETIEVFVVIPDTGSRVKLAPLTVDPETKETEGEWVYDPQRNSIRFESYRPPALSQLEITYMAAADIQPIDDNDEKGDEDPTKPE